MKPFNILVLLPFVLPALCSCGSNEQVSFKSGGLTQTMASGETAKKAGFPLPIYPNAQPTVSTSASRDDDSNHFMMLKSTDSVEKICTFYKEKLKDEGWEVSEQKLLPSLIKIDGSKRGEEASVMVSQDDTSTSISLTIATEIEGTPKVIDEHFEIDKFNPPTD